MFFLAKTSLEKQATAREHHDVALPTRKLYGGDACGELRWYSQLADRGTSA